LVSAHAAFGFLVFAETEYETVKIEVRLPGRALGHLHDAVVHALEVVVQVSR